MASARRASTVGVIREDLETWDEFPNYRVPRQRRQFREMRKARTRVGSPLLDLSGVKRPAGGGVLRAAKEEES